MDKTLSKPALLWDNAFHRICPGRLLAEASIFIAVANLLAAFDILPPLDESGREQSLPVTYTSGLIRNVLEFTVDLIN